MLNKRIIINVGRQLGSGGGMIAKMLANDFQYTLYDKEILNLAAKESGFSEKFFEQNDEKGRLLKSLFHMHAPHISDNNFYRSRFSEESLFQFQSDAIRKVAKDGGCVFVGRCADYVLRDFEDVVNIFITANIKDRIKMVRERHQCDEEAAQKIINQKENARASYYNFYTGKKWGYSDNYHLCVNSSLLGLEGTVEFIKHFIMCKYDGKE